MFLIGIGLTQCGKWDLSKKFHPSIEYLELYALAIAIEFWAHKLQNRRLIVFCDNQAVVEWINNACSPCKKSMQLIRMLTLTSIENNVRFFARYINTKNNFSCRCAEQESNESLLESCT